jgi:thiol:disulfide interchange protein
MTTHTFQDTTGADLGDRVDTVGWGLLFVAIGGVSLLPAMPDGSWLVAAGLVMLGASVARAWLSLPVRGVTVVVGVVALSAGIFIANGLTTEVGPLVLIVLGLTLIVGALYRAQRWTDGTPLAHTR